MSVSPARAPAPSLVEAAGHPVSLISHGSGPTLLFLHGAPLWSWSWRGLVHRLAPRFQCITLDYPGYGASPRPSHPLGVRATSYLVEAVMDVLGLDRVVLVMNDVGGAVGTGLAVRRPERIAGLVAIDALGFRVRPFPRVRLILSALALPMVRAVAARLDLLGHALRLAGLPRTLSTADRERVLAPMGTLEGRQRALALLADLWRDHAFLDELEAALPAIRHLPLLTCFGRHDPARRAGFVEAWGRHFPDHTAHTVRGGHFAQEDDPGTIAAAIASWYDQRVEAR